MSSARTPALKKEIKGHLLVVVDRAMLSLDEASRNATQRSQNDPPASGIRYSSKSSSGAGFQQ